MAVYKKKFKGLVFKSFSRLDPNHKDDLVQEEIICELSSFVRRLSCSAINYDGIFRSDEGSYICDS